METPLGKVMLAEENARQNKTEQIRDTATALPGTMAPKAKAQSVPTMRTQKRARSKSTAPLVAKASLGEEEAGARATAVAESPPPAAAN